MEDTSKMEFEQDHGDMTGLGGSDSQQSQSHPSLGLQATPQKILISPDDLKAIAEMSLSSLVVGNYLVIVKSDFDIVVSEEPYLALMLLLNTMTGKYIARIWNQTVSTGNISTVEQLKDACLKHFELRPCMGIPFPENELGENGFDFIVSFAPVRSKVSKSCLKVRSKEASSEILSCSECLKLNASTKSKLQATEEVKKLLEESPMKTTEQTEMPESMPWGSGLRANAIKREPQEIWLQEYNNSDNYSLRSPKIQDEGSNELVRPELLLDIEFKEKIEQKPVPCLLCVKSFPSKKGLSQHMRGVHKIIKQRNKMYERIGRPRSFSCVQCNFKANLAGDLVEHMLQQNHVGEPIMCPGCEEEVEMTEIVTHYENCLSTYKNEQRKRKNDANNYKRRKARGLTEDDIVKMEIELQSKRSQKQEPQNPMKCPLCEKVLASYNSLWRHKVYFHHMGAFKCLRCSFGASFAKDMVEHMIEQNHADEPLVRCPSCKDKHHMTEIVSHYENCPRILEKERRKIVHKMQINEEGEVGAYQKGKGEIFPRKCLLCDTILQDKQRHSMHMRCVHHGGNFNCSKCKIRAVFAKDLVQHMEDEKHTDEPFVICPQCCDKYHMKDIVDHYEGCLTNALKNQEKAQRERREEHRMCQTCGKSFSGYRYYQHLKSHMIETGEESPEVYFCDQCGKQFMKKLSLKHHIQVDHENREYECKTCKQTFKTHNQRNTHQILEHSTDEKYNCKYCGKRFGNTGHLKSHITHYHEEPKFKCQFCGKMFKVKESLDDHERMHKGEKPFPCSLCAESFPSKKGHSQHMRGVHKIAKRGGRVGWGHGRKEKVNH